MDYRREIDGLRALAVLPVIFFHAGFGAFSGGFVGVDIFFVISGYLITSIIISEKQAGIFSIIKFYERRARRILPALFLVMATCIPFAWFWLLPGEMKEFSQSLAAVSLFSSNILFWQQSGYFDTAAELKPLLHTWSLAVEEQFYVLFPICLILAWRLGNKLLAALLAAATSLSLFIAHWGAFNKPAAAFFLLPTRGWELLMGALIAFYFARETRSTHQNLALGQSASILGLLLILYAVFAFDKNTPFPGLYALVPTTGTALIILFATPQTAAGILLGSKPFVGIGLISYSAYLWHQPLFAFSRHASQTEPSKQLLLLLSLAAIFLAYFSWRFVEQPFRQKGTISRKQVFAFSAITSLVFFSIGLSGYITKGFEHRYDDSDRYLGGIIRSEQGEYVETRFNRLKLKNFDATDNRKKILLIGDSYAQDLVNAVYESELASHFQLSTHHISARCGNLYLETDISDKIDIADSGLCSIADQYQSQRLRNLIADADMIWLASSWRYWQAELLPESISNIKRDFGKKVLVFGRKNFGSIDIKRLLSEPPGSRNKSANAMNHEHIRTNALMRSTLTADLFVDISIMLCGSDISCPLFTLDGKLISYDGGHLTVDGARYFGSKLMQHPLIDKLTRP